MPYYDLNVPWTQDEAELHRTLTFLHELGYDVIALNHTISGKLPNNLTSPIPKELPFSLPPSMRVLRRCTLLLSDPSQNHRLQLLAAEYDMLAIRPTNEKSLQQACSSQYCDLISIDLTQRFETHFKMKTLARAYENSIYFELCYAPGILASDSTVRRNLISNATQLIRNSRSRGLVISSGALRPQGCRAPADVVNLAAVWGLGQERGKEAIGKLARAAVVAASMKRTSFRGVVDVVHGGDNIKNSGEDKTSHGQKRKADALGDVTLSNGMPKPLSKTQQKKQKKAAMQAQAAAATTTTTMTEN